MLKLYLLTRKDDFGYDDTVAAIVAAETPYKAKRTPGEYGPVSSPQFLKCKFIGIAAPGIKPGDILTSFNAA